MYIITDTINPQNFRVTNASIVSGVVKLTTDNTYMQSDYIKLTEIQITRYNENPNDLQYIFEGVEVEQTLEQKKDIKRGLVEQAYQEKIGLGYTDVTENVTLRTDESAVNKFTRMKSLITDISDNIELPIWDKNSQKSKKSKNAYTQLLNRYGLYLVNLEEKHNDYLTAIAIAENETDLNNINITF